MFVYKRDLKPALKKIGMTQKELSKIVGKSERAVKGWVAGTSKPTYGGHEIIMKILGLNEDFSNTVVNVPVLSYVQAGEFTQSIEDIDPIGHMDLPAKLVPKNAFLLEVKGDSMTFDLSENQRLDQKYCKYSLSEGENILIDPNEVSHQSLIGKVVVARNSEGATVKLLYKEDNKLCLMPLNSKFQNNDDIKTPDDAEIIGKVVNSIRFRDFK
jgi:SOS-response transcriptional repressor LexA